MKRCILQLLCGPLVFLFLILVQAQQLFLSQCGGDHNKSTESDLFGNSAELETADYAFIISEALKTQAELANDTMEADIKESSLTKGGEAIIKKGTLAACDSDADCDIYKEETGIKGSCPVTGGPCVITFDEPGQTWPTCTTDADCDLFKADNGYTGFCYEDGTCASRFTESTPVDGDDERGFADHCTTGMAGNLACTSGGKISISADCFFATSSELTSLSAEGNVSNEACWIEDTNIQFLFEGALSLSYIMNVALSRNGEGAYHLDVDRNFLFSGLLSLQGAYTRDGKELEFNLDISTNVVLGCDTDTDVSEDDGEIGKNDGDCTDFDLSSGSVTVNPDTAGEFDCSVSEGALGCS